MYLLFRRISIFALSSLFVFLKTFRVLFSVAVATVMKGPNLGIINILRRSIFWCPFAVELSLLEIQLASYHCLVSVLSVFKPRWYR